MIDTILGTDPGASRGVDLPYRDLGGGVYAVPISDYLQITEHGLAYAMRKLPRTVRQGCRSLSWAGTFREDGQRWGKIRIER